MSTVVRRASNADLEDMLALAEAHRLHRRPAPTSDRPAAVADDGQEPGQQALGSCAQLVELTPGAEASLLNGILSFAAVVKHRVGPAGSRAPGLLTTGLSRGRHAAVTANALGSVHYPLRAAPGRPPWPAGTASLRARGTFAHAHLTASPVMELNRARLAFEPGPAPWKPATPEAVTAYVHRSGRRWSGPPTSTMGDRGPQGGVVPRVCGPCRYPRVTPGEKGPGGLVTRERRRRAAFPIGGRFAALFATGSQVPPFWRLIRDRVRCPGILALLGTDS
jgi:hypothetical protein